MEVLGGLIKEIGQIDSTLKLIAFLASIVVIIVLALLKKKTDLPKNVMNILLTLFVMVFLLAFAAMFIHPAPPPPGTYTLTVTVTDATGTPYRTDQVKVTVNNEYAPEANSSTSNTWSFLFHENELPKNRIVLISASTNDHLYFANVLDTLTYEPIQPKMLILDKAPVTSFSINLADTAIVHSLQRTTLLKEDPNSKANKIVITYDRGSITPDNEGIYSMTSSNPIVVIDGHRFVLEGCSIPPPNENATRHPQELIDYARRESIIVATTYLKRNPKVLAQWLTSMQH